MALPASETLLQFAQGLNLSSGVRQDSPRCDSDESGRCYSYEIGNAMDALCSARLLEPFKKLVASQEINRDLVPDGFWSLSGDARVSLQQTHSMLDRGVERLRDQQLGLKLG